MGIPPVRRSTVERRLSDLYGSVLPGLYLPSANYLASLSTLTYPGTLPWMHPHLSAKMDLKVKASGRGNTLYGLALSPEF